MFSRTTLWLIAAALTAAVSARADEDNAWPVFVKHDSPEPQTRSVQYVGPLFFAKETPGKKVHGFRPFYMETVEADRETDLLFYPFFSWQKRGDTRVFSFFQLVNDRDEKNFEGKPTHYFDVWPFYFSRHSGDERYDYKALFPVAGTIKNRFGRDRINFFVFPLYGHTEKDGRHIKHTPWPFVRTIYGNGHKGFELWPLFGHKGREGDYRSQFYLWPLIYKNERKLSEPVPSVSVGFLPFYTRDTAPGYINENFVWPFFGYSDRTEPVKYHETRYFWPFLVQAHGDVRNVNRWAPFYTHSVNKGYDKTWYLWPLVRHAEWTDDGITQEKNQFLYFVYWSLKQTSATNPNAAPAHKTHLWPLISSWDNGAGRKQAQVLSPFEVFFPTNEPIRQLYTPFFAIYRFDQQAPNHTRHAVLWNLLSWKNTPADKEFHLGPILNVKAADNRQRIALGRGLISLQRPRGERVWRLKLFDFRSTPAPSPATAAATP
ncbi:hypothetical protein [Oleiharenicola lentus]|uniref:hypothetical protein n=1 Tax=Oleiharenicola lentus TaxID=2508720 RepID=UPI003F670827